MNRNVQIQVTCFLNIASHFFQYGACAIHYVMTSYKGDNKKLLESLVEKGAKVNLVDHVRIQVQFVLDGSYRYFPTNNNSIMLMLPSPNHFIGLLGSHGLISSNHTLPCSCSFLPWRNWADQPISLKYLITLHLKPIRMPYLFPYLSCRRTTLLST